MKRPWLRWALALAFTTVAVWLVARNPEPVRALARIDFLVLLAMVALVLVNQLVSALRLGFAIEECADRVLSAWAWFRLTAIGQFLNLLVPQLGNVYRAVMLKREEGITYVQYAAGLFAFVWIDLLIGILLALAVIVVISPDLSIGQLPGFVVLACLFVAVLAGPLVLERLVAGRSSGRLAAARERAAEVLTAAARVLRQPRYVVRALALNVVLVATHVASLHFAFRAVGAELGLAQLMLFQVLLRLSSQIVITPGNLGLTELAYGALASVSGATTGHGIAAALLIRTLGSMVVVALGLLLGGATHLMQRRRLIAESPSDSAVSFLRDNDHVAAVEEPSDKSRL